MTTLRQDGWRVIVGLLAMLTLVPSAWSQAGPLDNAKGQAQPDLYMLSVGVDKYQPPTNSLQGCVADAVGMAKVFQGQAGKQFGNVEAKLLTDYAATQAAITSQFKAIEAKGRPGDWYVILLSGHGGIVRNQWGFLTHDNRNLFDDVLLGAADRLAADGKKVLVIIDACNAGQLRHAAAGILGRHTDPDKGGIILMVSSMPDQLSTALGTYSAFARAVEEGLQGMADHDGDELITLKELRRFTHTRVYELRLKRRVFPGVTPSWQESAISIKTILFATDFSPQAMSAYEFACSLARDYQAKMLIAHVKEPPVVVVGEFGVPAADFMPTDQALREELLKLQPAGLQAEHFLLTGQPAEEIVRVAQEHNSDVIVMGTHGRRGLNRLLMGSVAEQVVRKAPCPVLTVKLPVVAGATATPASAEAVGPGL